MYFLSLKDLQALSGLSAAIIRLWETRHDLLRKTSARQKGRNYNDEELKRLLRLPILYRQGWKTTELATLSHDEIKTATSGHSVTQTKTASHVQALLLAAIDLSEPEFNNAFNEAVIELGFETAFTTVAHPYLSCLALLSKRDQPASAKEYFSMYLLETRLISETESLPSTPDSSPQLVLFSPATLSVQLPLLHLNYLLRKAGWKVLYLGQSKKLNDLLHAINHRELTYLWIHVGHERLLMPIDDYLSLIRQALPHAKIVVSGNGTEKTQRHFRNVFLLNSDAAIKNFIKTYPFGTT